METERSEKVNAVFDAALPLDRADREALLRERCAGDPELRAEVERLLTDHEALLREACAEAPELRAGAERLLADPVRGDEDHFLTASNVPDRASDIDTGTDR